MCDACIDVVMFVDIAMSVLILSRLLCCRVCMGAVCIGGGFSYSGWRFVLLLLSVLVLYCYCLQ